MNVTKSAPARTRNAPLDRRQQATKAARPAPGRSRDAVFAAALKRSHADLDGAERLLGEAAAR